MNKIKSNFSFCNGTKKYNLINKYYKKHKKGYLILGPPGIGKTFFIKNQKGNLKNWIDSDDLCGEFNVKWHLNNNNLIEQKLNYLRAEYILEQSRALGYRIIGSLFWEDITPDAIVIPRLNIHKKYLKNRKDLDLKNIIFIRNLLKKISKKRKIKIFEDINKAVKFLENK